MDVRAHLLNLVREADHDRYLSVLYAPAEKRTALMALYAFNAEIAATRDRIHEPMAGELRLQWWQDAIGAEEGARTGNPVADSLLDSVAGYQLPKAAFIRLLETRIFDLYNDPMPDRATLEGYCGETASAIIQLATWILDPRSTSDWANAAGHAGCAQAVAGLMRLMPIHRARGQCYVPADILASAGLSAEEFISGENQGGAKQAVLAMVALAREHFAAFRIHAKGLPQPLRAAYLPLAPVPAYLSRIAADPGGTLDQVKDISGLRRQFLFLRKAMRGWD